MRRRGFWALPAAVVLIALAVLLFTDLVGLDLAPFLPKLRIQRSRTWSSSSVTLEAVRDLYAFNTVEYVHRAVFPYDYLPEDISLTDIIAKLRSANATVAEALTPEEYLYFQTYNLAVDVGMDLGSPRDFVVVTVVVTAGFDLQALGDPGAAPDTDGSNQAGPGFRAERVTTPEGVITRAIVSSPSPSITDIRVEDIVAERYPYPDISISADSWRRVAGFIEEQVTQMPEIEQLLIIAGENGREFVRDVLTRSGYDVVVFQQP